MEIDLKFDTFKAVFTCKGKVISRSKYIYKFFTKGWWEIFDQHDELIAITKSPEKLKCKNFCTYINLLRLNTGTIIHFTNKRSYYELDLNGEKHELFKHANSCISYFVNNQQIGYLYNDNSSFEMKLFFDDDIAIDVILPIISIAMTEYHTDSFGYPSAPFGNIGREMKPFDRTWEPKTTK